MRTTDQMTFAVNPFPETLPYFPTARNRTPFYRLADFDPRIDGRLDPRWDWYGAQMTALTNEIRDYPVVLPRLQILDPNRNHLCVAEATACKHGEDRPVAYGREV